MHKYMNDKIVSSETAKLLKEKGFDWESFYFIAESHLSYYKERLLQNVGRYVNANHPDLKNISFPTQSLVAKWLRDIHKIFVTVSPCFYRDDEIVYQAIYSKATERENLYVGVTYVGDESPAEFHTYEDALEAGLQEALKLI